MHTADLPVASHPTARLVGAAPAMETLRAQIRRLATFDVVGGALVPISARIRVMACETEHSSSLSPWERVGVRGFLFQ